MVTVALLPSMEEGREAWRRETKRAQRMRFKDFQKRDDLCHKGQSRVLYCPGVGSIVKTSSGWYATNDVRLELVGVKPNSELCGPTLGPFKDAKEAFEAYDKENRRLKSAEQAGWPG